MVGRRRHRAGLRRAARAHRQRRRPAARRLALPRGRAVLRRDPRQPDGAGEPPPLPLDRRADHRLLGRGVHPRRARGPCRAGRPVRVHRQPGQQPLRPDARRARHHPGRPGRRSSGPARVARSSSTAARAPARPSSHCTARRTCSYADPRLGAGRGGVLFVGPHQPYLAYVADVLPEPRRGRRADLHAARPRRRRGHGAGGARPGGGPAQGDRPTWSRRSSRRSRFYEEPPTEAHDGRDAVGRRPAQPARLGRGVRGGRSPGRRTTRPATQVWEELLTILVDKHETGHDDAEVPDDLRPPSARAEPRAASTTFSRAWPLLEPDRPGRRPVVGAGLPAQMRALARLEDEVRALQRADPQAWTVSDLPLLDAARQRLGDPDAARRRRRREAAVAAEREQMSQVVDHLVASDDSEMQVMSMLRGDDLRERAGRRGRRCPARTPTCWPGRSRTSSWTRRRS